MIADSGGSHRDKQWGAIKRRLSLSSQGQLLWLYRVCINLLLSKLLHATGTQFFERILIRANPQEYWDAVFVQGMYH